MMTLYECTKTYYNDFSKRSTFSRIYFFSFDRVRAVAIWSPFFAIDCKPFRTAHCSILFLVLRPVTIFTPTFNYDPTARGSIWQFLAGK